MSETAVDRIYSEFRDAAELLQSMGEISLSTAMDANSRKALLLAAASYFESKLSTDVLQFCQEIAGENPLISALVRNKAVSRQYHTWFKWDVSNANAFFAMFGPEFKTHMEALLKSDEALQAAIKEFMEVGRDRNRLVHEDFATFTLEKTAEEIYSQYKAALAFVERVAQELSNCSKACSEPSPTILARNGAQTEWTC